MLSVLEYAELSRDIYRNVSNKYALINLHNIPLKYKDSTVFIKDPTLNLNPSHPFYAGLYIKFKKRNPLLQ